MHKNSFPFSAIVEQGLMKLALLLNVIDPTLGGVLIKGERGTAKSTGVRALVDLLPTIRVVDGCPYRCSPDRPFDGCPFCGKKLKNGDPLPERERTIGLVNLPIGTTEDRLLGSIDIEKALKTGEKCFEPGLLAEAHRGILYVDEVNLLNDQIVDLFLDAAASGMNMVEREGISFSHPSRFVLVGTMNPEEGDLRPQLLDRFGLSVTIQSVDAVRDRIEIVKRRLAFEQDPEGFRAAWRQADEDLAHRIVLAKESLPGIVFTEELIETAAKVVVAMGTDGHRADIAMMKTARANAAFEGRTRVTMEDLQLAARLVLPHRIKKTPLQKSEFNAEQLKDLFDQNAPVNGPGEEWSPVHRNRPKKASQVKAYKSPVECVTHLCAGAKQVLPHVPWYRIMPGTHPGKRFTLPDPRKGGYVHGSRLPRTGDTLEDLSVIATLRAAAPHQHTRNGIGNGNSSGNGAGSIKISWDDMRLRKRSRRTGLALVLIVDSSASMRTNDRMSVTKGVIEALLQDLYLHRDKLGIITFRHRQAEIVMPLTLNIRDAAEGVERLPVGGRTPLAAGLDLGIRLLLQEKRKNPEVLPAMLLFSDGNPNVSCFGGDPLDETFYYAREVKRHGIQSIVVDTQTFSPMDMGCGVEIAGRMGATYLTLDGLY